MRARGYWLGARTQADGASVSALGSRDETRDSVGLRVSPDSGEVQFMAASAVLLKDADSNRPALMTFCAGSPLS